MVPKCPNKGEGCSACCRTVPYSNWTTCSFLEFDLTVVLSIEINFLYFSKSQADAEVEQDSHAQGGLVQILLVFEQHYQPHPPQPSECADFQEIWALASLGLVFEQELEWMTVREFPYAIKFSTDKVKEDSKRTWKTRNLCFAKHRHSSMLKPASRFVLHTSAIIHAAMETLVIASVTISHFNWFVVIDPGIEWPNLSQIQGSTQGEQRPSPRRMLSRFCFPSMRKPYFKWRWCVTQHKRSLTCHFAWLTDLILLWLSICTVSFWFSCGKVAWSTLWGSGSVTRTPWTCLKCELQWMVSWTESTPCFSNRKLFRFNPTHDMSLDGK